MEGASQAPVMEPFEAIPQASTDVVLGSARCPVHPFIVEYIKRQQFQIENLEQELDKSHRHAEELDAEISFLKNNLAIEAGRFDIVADKLTAAEDEISRLIEAVQQSTAENVTLTAQFEETVAALTAQLNETTDVLTQQVDVTRDTLTTHLDTTTTALTDKILLAEDEIRRLLAVVADLEPKAAKLVLAENEIVLQQEALETLAAQFQAKSDEFESYSASLRDEMALLTEQNQMFVGNDLGVLVEQLQAALHSANGNNVHLEKQVEGYVVRIAELEVAGKVNAELAVQVPDLKAEVEALKTAAVVEARVHEVEVFRLQDLLLSQAKNITTLEDEIVRVHAMIETQARRAAADASVAQNECARLQRQVADAQSYVTRVKDLENIVQVADARSQDQLHTILQLEAMISSQSDEKGLELHQLQQMTEARSKQHETEMLIVKKECESRVLLLESEIERLHEVLIAKAHEHVEELQQVQFTMNGKIREQELEIKRLQALLENTNQRVSSTNMTYTEETKSLRQEVVRLHEDVLAVTKQLEAQHRTSMNQAKTHADEIHRLNLELNIARDHQIAAAGAAASATQQKAVIDDVEKLRRDLVDAREAVAVSRALTAKAEDDVLLLRAELAAASAHAASDRERHSAELHALRTALHLANQESASSKATAETATSTHTRAHVDELQRLRAELSASREETAAVRATSAAIAQAHAEEVHRLRTDLAAANESSALARAYAESISSSQTRQHSDLAARLKADASGSSPRGSATAASATADTGAATGVDEAKRLQCELNILQEEFNIFKATAESKAVSETRIHADEVLRLRTEIAAASHRANNVAKVHAEEVQKLKADIAALLNCAPAASTATATAGAASTTASATTSPAGAAAGAAAGPVVGVSRGGAPARFVGGSAAAPAPAAASPSAAGTTGGGAISAQGGGEVPAAVLSASAAAIAASGPNVSIDQQVKIALLAATQIHDREKMHLQARVHDAEHKLHEEKQKHKSNDELLVLFEEQIKSLERDHRELQSSLSSIGDGDARMTAVALKQLSERVVALERTTTGTGRVGAVVDVLSGLDSSSVDEEDGHPSSNPNKPPPTPAERQAKAERKRVREVIRLATILRDEVAALRKRIEALERLRKVVPVPADGVVAGAAGTGTTGGGGGGGTRGGNKSPTASVKLEPTAGFFSSSKKAEEINRLRLREAKLLEDNTRLMEQLAVLQGPSATVAHIEVLRKEISYLGKRVDVVCDIVEPSGMSTTTSGASARIVELESQKAELQVQINQLLDEGSITNKSLEESNYENLQLRNRLEEYRGRISTLEEVLTVLEKKEADRAKGLFW